ncbi:mediator of RNA polymerase II transcription subunit 19-like [Liolophura sinensis]|uniref:mediator of RNA polymerase II transcription subunit 19-like n=1 Tax=Liolophura sinensis TaxID=3198878 RepID=UPI0031585CEA
MNEVIRRPDQTSPKSSPRGGSRSPAYPRTDTTGTLRTTISLGKVPSVIPRGPFYLMKDPPDHAEITGSTNLMSVYGMEHAYSKFCGRKVKEELSAFLPHLPGYIDTPGLQDNSALRSVVDKPPITGKELVPLSGSALTGFRLHPGPLPEQYRLMNQMPQKKRHKHKKHTKKETPKEEALLETQADKPSDAGHDRRKKQDKKDEKDKKRKRKKKKKKHSPEHQSAAAETGS